MRRLPGMKQLHSPDVRGDDAGDTTRGIPDALADEGGLDTGVETQEAPGADEPAMRLDHGTPDPDDDEGSDR